MRKECFSRKLRFNKLLSLVMAIAVALTMCFVAVPQKVLADSSTSFYISSSGTITEASSSGTGDYVATLSSRDSNVSLETIKSEVSYSSGILTISNISLFSLSISKNDVTIKSIGTNTFDYLFLIDSATSITIKMTKGSTIDIQGVYGSDGISEAYESGIIKIIGGTISGSSIVANADAESAALAVNETSYEQGKSADDSATYKVTSNTENNLTVSYEKPANNISGKEIIKDTVTLSDGLTYNVTTISDNAFAKCTALKSITLGDNVETIGDSAFEGCTKLTSLVIEKNVKKIGKKAYYKCSSLKKITVKSTKLNKKSKIGKNAFKGIKKTAKIKIKMSKQNAKKYKTGTINAFKSKKIGYVNTWSVK